LRRLLSFAGGGAVGSVGDSARRPEVWLVLPLGMLLGAYAVGLTAVPQRLSVLLLAAMVFAAIGAVVGDLERLLLAIVLIDISFPIDVHLGYRSDIASFGALGGLDFSLTTICLTLLYVLWLTELMANRGRLRRSSLVVSTPLALYVAFAAASVAVARDAALSSFELLLLLQTFLLFVYIATRVRTRRQVCFLVGVLLVGVALQGFMTLVLRVTGHSFAFAGLSGRVDVGTAPGGVSSERVGGTVGSPNTAAAYFTLLLAPALALLFAAGGHRRLKQLALLAFPLGVVAVILTLSRGGWIALGLSVTIVCVVAWYRGWLPLGGLIAIAVGVALLLLPFHELIGARLSGGDKGSAASRVPLMHIAANMIRDHPLFGVGANNFAEVLPRYVTPEFTRDWLYTVHNKYLLVWAETGIGGVIAFVFFMGETIRKAWACVRTADPLMAPLALGFAAAVVGQMAHMFFDVFHSRPQVQSLWVVAALVAAMHAILRSEAAAEAEEVVA
jgi:O-antigen ligase